MCCAYGKTYLIHISLTPLFVSLLWCFAGCVAHLQQSPTTSLLYAGRRQLSACQRKVTELFLCTATAWRSNACHSARQLQGISPAVVFPGKIVKQWGGRRAELSIRADQRCTSSWAFNSRCQSLCRPGSWGEPWGNPNLDMNWMGRKRDGGGGERGRVWELKRRLGVSPFSIGNNSTIVVLFCLQP